MNSDYIEGNKIALSNFLSQIEILSFDDKCAEAYGEIRANLEKRGQINGNFNMLIASHAISYNYTLVTNNVKEFGCIKYLKIINWNI